MSIKVSVEIRKRNMLQAAIIETDSGRQLVKSRANNIGNH